MRFIFRPPAAHAAGLLSLPWETPLEEWVDDRLLEVAHRGISRHVVRFVEVDGHVYALKEIDERLARREYRLLGELEAMEMPAVSVLGICVERGGGQDAVLVTRFLDYSMSYRYVFSHGHTQQPTDRLVDAMVELLARLHLARLFWGDCSLSNTLFRPDAGSVAGSTSTPRWSGSAVSCWTCRRAAARRRRPDRAGRRAADALPRAVGGADPRGAAASRRAALPRGRARRSAQRAGFRRRRDRARHHGGGHPAEGAHAGGRVRPAPPPAVRPHRTRSRRTRHGGCSTTSSATGQVYDRVLAMVPADLSDRLAPAEVFHEILEHRWFLSERAGTDVGTTAAVRSYVQKILPATPKTLTVLPESPGAPS